LNNFSYKIRNSFFYINFKKKYFKLFNHIPLLDRWLVSEILPPLFFAIAAFTIVSLSVGVMFDLIRQIVELGLPLQIAIKVLLLRLPSFLVLSFPMAMLMATLLAFSRLTSNSELKALRSLGISTKRIIAPAIIVSILMTGLTFFFNDNLVPKSNRLAELTLREAVGKSLATEQGKDIIYSKFGLVVNSITTKKIDGLTHLFYAKRYINETMLNVTVLDFSNQGNTQMLVAEKAKWNKSEGNWIFLNGKVLNLSDDGTSSTIKFDRYLYPLGDGPIKIAELPKDANDMTVSEALKAKKLYQDVGNVKEARRMSVRIHEKFTLPMACVVFSLIGSSLGAKPNSRTSRSQGFGLSVVLILFYYVLSFSFSSLGVKGTISPLLAAWSPVFISMIGGLVLLREASR
tara:strand:- start:9708 stop:10913 length:1206 start_codon:yes stop_codon:yes gene_type:complete